MRRLTLDGVAPAEAARIALAARLRHGPEAGNASTDHLGASQLPDGAPGQGRGSSAGQRSLSARGGGAAAVAGATGSGSGGALQADDPGEGDVTGTPLAAAGAPSAAAGTPSAVARPGPGRSWTADAYPPGPITSSNGSGGRVLALPGASPSARGLARAAMALDAEAIRRIVVRALDFEGVVATWDGLMRPVLAATGRRWEATGEGIEVEHLLTECAIGALRAYADGAHGANSRAVLLACGPGDRHSLPLFAVAAGLAERGVSSRMLGPAVPTTALRSAVARTGPAAVLVWAQMRLAADGRGVGSLPATRPPTATVVGGPGWRGLALPPRVVLVNDLSEAVETLTGPIVGA
jgi:hypothetical protein